jgi:hypothetical protein
MESSLETNRLTIVSFISGLIVLLSLGLYYGLISTAYPTSPGQSPLLPERIIIAIMDGSVSVRNFCALTALVTGILGLREIKIKDGNEKGKILAWIGIVIGSGWLLLGLLVGISFFLAEFFHRLFSRS